MDFSVIIPVYNRPEEIFELLNSLTLQEEKPFEVLVIEDGSDLKCEEIVSSFQSTLNIKYYYISNVGQGFARNFGMEHAKGDFFVLFDSDCIIPGQYFKVLKKEIQKRNLDAFGGPDAADADFSLLQKAMNYSMTSFLTTGGIRGKLKNPAQYQARGYNMGLSRSAFLISKGFSDPNKGEDIELSIRLKKLGFKLELVEDAFVYHKRKSTLYTFFRQSYSFGQNRINISRYHTDAVKLIHLMPLFFLCYWIGILLALFAIPHTLILNLSILVLAIWKISILIHSAYLNKSILVGFISIITSFGQLSAYGLGLFTEWFNKKINT